MHLCLLLACSCADGGPALRFNDAQAIFVGQIQGGTERFTIPQRDGTAHELEAGSVRFTVEEVFKGAISGEVTIEVVSSRGTSCGPYGLQRGVRYLMYAHTLKNEPEPKRLYNSYCSRSTPLGSALATKALQFLRSLPPVGTGGTLVGSVWENLQWQGRSSFPNFTVHLRGPEGQFIETVTDQAGRFEVTGLAPGKYRVEPQFPRGYVAEYRRTYEVRVDDRGTAAIGIDAYIDGHVTGRLMDREGRGYNNASLRMELEDDSIARRGAGTVFGSSRGGHGAFEFFGVPPGRYRMSLELRDTDYEKEDRRYYYPGTFERGEAAVVSLGRAEVVGDLEFQLPKGFLVRTVEGRVVSPDGKPVANAGVSLNCARSSDAERGVLETQMFHEVTSDADGRFRLEAVTGTVYWLEARVQAETRNASRYSPGIRLTAAQDVRNQTLVLSQAGESEGCALFAELEAVRRIQSQPRRPGVGEVDALIAEAHERLGKQHLIEPPGSSARETLLRLRMLAPKQPEVANLARLLSDRLLEKGRNALRALAYERSAQLLRAARQVGSISDPAALAQVEAELSAAREQSGL